MILYNQVSLVGDLLIMAKHRKIFISHCWGGTEYYTLKQWCEEANHFQFSDYSISQEKAFTEVNNPQLKANLEGQIIQCGIFIAPTSLSMSHSDWIEYEISIAKKYNKPILAVQPLGQQRHSVIVTSNANHTVSWRRESFIDAIRRLY